MRGQLESFELRPRGDGGWTSGSLRFGRTTTLVLGPNGSGKTPLIKTLAFALGYPVELPPEVLRRCFSVAVTIRTSDGLYQIERELADGVAVTVTSPTGESQSLNDEKSLSGWILERLGIAPRSLAGKSGGRVSPYISLVGPAFIVEQDNGWSIWYHAHEKYQFAQSQREEVLRWMLALPPRHKAVDKSAYREAKIDLESIREQIAFKRRGIEALYREIGEDRNADAGERLLAKKAAVEGELRLAHSFLERASQSETLADRRLADAMRIRNELDTNLATISRRRSQLLQAADELQAELVALEENEIAADAFRSLCGNENCQFFRKPEDSFGRRVLYLKDQLKDIESSEGWLAREIETGHADIDIAQSAVLQATELKTLALKTEGAPELIQTVDRLARELTDITVRLDRLERIQRERRQLESLIDKEARASETVADLRPTGERRSDGTRVLDARQALAASMNEWLRVLRTPNIGASVMFDEDLRLVVENELFSSSSSQSGSTRTRLVLAHHAAVLQVSMKIDDGHPRLLILDSPKQHELKTEDLRAFVDRFHEIASKEQSPVQLVLSATNAEIVSPGKADETWIPHFLSPTGELHFLGNAAESGTSKTDETKEQTSEGEIHPSQQDDEHGSS